MQRLSQFALRFSLVVAATLVLRSTGYA